MKIHMRLPLLSTALFLLGAILQAVCLPGSSKAFEFANPSFHYTVDLPDDWEKMDPAALQEFDAGFVKSDTVSGYPYMLIEHKRAGLSFAQLAAQYDKANLNAITIDQPGLSGAPRFETAAIDRQRHQIVIPASFEVEGVGPVKGLTVLSLGKTGLVNMYFYTLADAFDSDYATFKAIMDSLAFEEGYRADDTQDERVYKRKPLLKVVGTYAFGAIAGLIVFRLISYLRSRKRGA